MIIRSNHSQKIALFLICTILLLGQAATAKSEYQDDRWDDNDNNKETLVRPALYKVDLDELCLPMILKNYCPLLYTDDFSNPDSGWPDSDDGNIRFAYTNGEYEILIRVYDETAIATPGVKVTDFIAEVDVRVFDPFGTGSQGFLFGLSDSLDEFYQVVLFSNEHYYSILRHDPNPPLWTDLAHGESSAIQVGTASNYLKIQRIGATITLYINEQWIVTVEDETYTGPRNFGLVVTSELGNGAFFDNLVMHNPGCESR